MATTHLPKRNMRNQPTKAICDFSRRLEVNYSCDLPESIATQCMLQLFLTSEFKRWEETAVNVIRRQGKPFTITRSFDGVSVSATGKRI